MHELAVSAVDYFTHRKLFAAFLTRSCGRAALRVALVGPTTVFEVLTFD